MPRDTSMANFENEFGALQAELLEKLFLNQKYNARCWKKHPEFRKKLETTESSNWDTLQEKLWALRNTVLVRPTCGVCGSKVAFRSSSAGFFQTCSVKCAASAPARIQKIKKTCLERYGSHHTQNKEWITSFVNKQHASGAYKKAVKTFEKRYGVQNRFQLDSVKKKIKCALLETYGVENPQQSSEVRERTKSTNIARYGAPYLAQVPEIFEKQQRAQIRSGYRVKTAILESGRVIQYQGYELEVFNRLIELGIKEEDILIGQEHVPTVDYCFNGQVRRYFPDIFIPRKNLLIEVKSTYTWKRDQQKNLAKHYGSLEAGYDHWIVVWNMKSKKAHFVL